MVRCECIKIEDKGEKIKQPIIALGDFNSDKITKFNEHCVSIITNESSITYWIITRKLTNM